MNIKTKDSKLFYISCLLCSEIDKIEKNLLATNVKLPYHENIKYILQLKDRYIELALSGNTLSET